MHTRLKKLTAEKGISIKALVRILLEEDLRDERRVAEAVKRLKPY